MRTTISIDEELMDELMRAEKGVSRSEAIRRAIANHLRRKRIEHFLTLAGSHLVDSDWREMKQQSIDRALELERRWNRAPNARKRSRPA